MQWRMAADGVIAGPASADHGQECCWEQLYLLAISSHQCSVSSLSRLTSSLQCSVSSLSQLTSNTASWTRPD